MEVVREIVLPEPPGEVWAALTEPERLEEWFAPEVELDAEPGGAGTFRWGDGEERHAVVVEVEPERRLVYTWDDGEEESRVVLELEPVEEGTRPTVTEAPTGEWSAALELRALCVLA